MTEVVPERRAAPSTVLICEDVYNLLYELGGCDIIPVLGGPDQVIAHLLLVAFLSGILSTLRLQTKENKSLVSNFALICFHLYYINSNIKTLYSNDLSLFKNYNTKHVQYDMSHTN